ncbi:MAG: ATP-dependent zinc protease [Bradymonadaceae bacterium]
MTASTSKKKKTRPVIGWREWATLTDLGLPAIKAKVDTGARSSAIHAYEISTFERDGVHMVRFLVHPVQRNTRETVAIETPIHDEREVRSSTGHGQLRIVIRPLIKLFDESWPIDLTLTNRELMGFRMLLGREALRGRFLIDPSKSFLAGQPEDVI